MKNIFLGLFLGFFITFSSHLMGSAGFNLNIDNVAHGIIEDQMLSRAKIIYNEAHKRGEFTALVKIADGSALRKSPAWVSYSHNGCEFFLAPAYAKQFSTELSFKFLVLHELSHCEAYHTAPPAFSWPSLSKSQNRLLSDLIELEALMLIDDERQNGYSIFQETYADIRAWALMIRGGVKAEDLMAFYALRNDGFDRRHDTHSVLPEMGKYPWEQYSLAEFEEKVSFLTGQTLLENFICPTWLGGESCALNFDWETYWKSNTNLAINQWFAFKNKSQNDDQITYLKMLIIDANFDFLFSVPVWNYFAQDVKDNQFSADSVALFQQHYRSQVYPFGVDKSDLQAINLTVNTFAKEKNKKSKMLH